MQKITQIRPAIVLYLAQVINLLLGWGITKLNVSFLSIEEFGQYSFFITFINSTFILFTFGVFEASSRLLALSESRENTMNMLSASLLLALFSYVIFSGFLFISQEFIRYFFSIDISFLLKLYFPLAGVFLLYDFWQKILRGTGKIIRLSWFLMTPRILYFVFLLALLYTHQFTLVNSTLFNLLSLGFVFLLYLSMERLSFKQLAESFRLLKRQVKDFGFHMYWAELIHSLLYHIDKLFIGYFLNAEQLAYYSLAFTITLPLSLFSTSLSTTLYKRFSQINTIDRKVLRINLIWVIFSLSLLILLGPWIVTELFSENYRNSIPLLLPLGIAFSISSQSKTFTFYLIAQGKGKVIRNIAFILFLGSLLLNGIFIPTWGILGAAYVRIIVFLIDLALVYAYYWQSQQNLKG